MEQQPQRYSRACGPCKRRKSKCGKIKPCPSCIVYGTQEKCYNAGEVLVPPFVRREASSSSTSGTLSVPTSRATSTAPLFSPSSEVDVIADIGIPDRGLRDSIRRGKRKATIFVESEEEPVRRSTGAPTGDRIGLQPFPPVNECELALYCYITEIQWSVTAIDDHMRQNFRKLINAGEANRLEEAYIYLILATVGKLAAESFTVIYAPTVRDPAVQERYLQSAETILSSYEQSIESLSLRELILLGQSRLLQAQYYMTVHDLANGLKYFKEAAKCASLTVLLEFITDDLDEPLKHSANRLRVEASVADVWISCMMDQPPEEGLDHIDSYTSSPQDDPIDVTLIQQKLRAKVLAKSTRDLLTSPEGGSLEWATDLLTKSEEIEAFCDELASTYSSSPTLINNIVSFKTHFTTNTIRLFLLAKRLRLLGAIASVDIPSNAESKRLDVAAEIIKETSRSLALLQAPWRKMIGRVGSVIHVEQAMQVFVNEMTKTGLTSLDKVKERQGTSSTAQPPAPLVDFITNFDTIYHMLHTLGLIGKAGTLCAQILKPKPIKRSPPLAEQHLSAISSAIQKEESERQVSQSQSQSQSSSLSTLLADWLGSEMDLDTLEESLRSMNQ